MILLAQLALHDVGRILADLFLDLMTIQAFLPHIGRRRQNVDKERGGKDYHNPSQHLDARDHVTSFEYIEPCARFLEYCGIF